MKKSGNGLVLFFSVVIAALTVKLFVFDILFISGPSMKPTLQTGSVVCVFKLAWGLPVPFSNRYAVRWGEPKEGEVVIYPLKGKYVIKRCAGRSGSRLVFSDERGYSVSVGERKIPLDDEQYQKLKNADCVPDGMIFAVGDNMAESRDSRDYGFVSIDSVRGKALWK